MAPRAGQYAPAALTFANKLLQRHFMETTSISAPREQDRPVLCPLADTGLIEVTGADAVAFLDAQLSRNVESGELSRAPLSAWLDARGRVLALFRVIRIRNHRLLLTKGADVEALVRRLGMFVLRADVRVRNVSQEWRAAAVLGSIEPWLATRSIRLGAQPGDAAIVNGAFVIRVGLQLVYLVADGDTLADFENNFPAGRGESAAVEEIRLGLVDMVPEITGRYTAHMLNLDRLGAVAFDKGCYPGQEVVARTQNLGSVKRRVFRFSGMLSQAPAVGASLLDSSGIAVGAVVRAATADETRVELLAVVRVDAVSGALASAAEASVPLTRKTLSGV